MINRRYFMASIGIATASITGYTVFNSMNNTDYNRHHIQSRNAH